MMIIIIISDGRGKSTPMCRDISAREGPSGWTQRFNQYFGAGGKRMRCVGIIAGAKWLAIALWCRLELREIPFRTTLKIQTPR